MVFLTLGSLFLWRAVGAIFSARTLAGSSTRKKKQAGLILGFGLAIVIICASGAYFFASPLFLLTLHSTPVGLGWKSRGFIAIAIFAVSFWYVLCCCNH